MSDPTPAPTETPGQHCARWLKAAKKETVENNTVLTWDRIAKIIDATLTGLNYFGQVNAPVGQVTQPPKAKKSDVKATFSEFGDRKAIPPSPEQVTAYSASIGIRLEGQEFIDHYQSNGWKVGKASMKDWQAAVRTWGRDPRRKISPTNSNITRDYSKI